MFKFENGCLVGRDDETGELYMDVKLSDQLQKEYQNVLNQQ